MWRSRRLFPLAKRPKYIREKRFPPRSSNGKDAFFDEINFFDGIKGLGVEGFYQTNDADDFPPGHDGENDFNLTAGAVPVDACDAVVFGFEALNQRHGVLGCDDPNHHNAEAEPLGDRDPDEVAHRKASRVGDVTCGIGQVIHGMPDSHEPDQDFHEADERRDVFHSSRDEYDPHRSQGDVGHTGHEDQ